MPKKRAKYTQPTDENQLASMILDLVSDPKPAKKERVKNPKSVAAGRKGGLVGGQSRKHALSPDERKAIATRAAKTRWKS